MGLTVKNTSLTIKSADPEKHGGHYYCGAKNSVGSSISNTVTMNVSYAPSCTSTHGQPNVYQVPLGGAVDVTCHVTASPVSDVRYKWTFEPLRHSSPVSSSGSPSSSSVFVFGQHHGQSTKESRQRNANAVGVNNVNSSNGLSDTLHFRLNSTNHYGLLSCWPSNIIGNSSEPCEFIIARPPGPPRAPSNCGIENRTDGHLFVQCSELQGDPGSNLDMLADRSYFGSLGSRTFSEASSSAVTYHLDIYKMSSGQAGHGGSNVASLIASFANVQRPVFEVTADQLVQIRTDKTGKGNKLEPSEASNMSFVIYASNKQHGNSSTVQMTFELSVPKFLDPSLELFKKDTREEMSLNQVSNYSSNLSASIPSIIESKPVILVISVISVTMTLFVVILVTQVTKLSRQREARKTATEGNGEKEEEEENKRKMRRNSISPKFTTLSSSRITKVRTSPLGPLDSSNVTGIDHECSHHQSSVSSEHLLLRDPRKVLSLTGSPRDDFDHSSNLNSSKALDCSKTDLLSFQLDNVLTSPDIIQLTSNAMHVLIVKPRLEYYHDDGDDNILETGFNEKKSPHSFANAGETLDSTSTNYNSETTPQDPTSIPPDHVTYRVFSVSTPV
ncbi:hypothetical protein HDE_14325 [Halotydeus destructor]|nr:hypothetical protein HDE_14325 [Halotydeus destructor]